MTDKPAADGSMLSRTGSGMALLIVGLACGGAIAIAPDIAAAVMVLLIPGALALILDPSPGRAIGKTMLLCQSAASVHPIVSIWSQCDGLRECVALVTDRRTVLIIVLAAAGGFVLAQALPMVLKVLDDARIKVRCEHLTMERQKLLAEWELDK
jgi:hypothetical protein